MNCHGRQAQRALLLLACLALLIIPLGSYRTEKSEIGALSIGSNADPIVFLVSAGPTSMSIVQGYSGWSTIDVATLPGQVGNVSLAAVAPAGLTATLNTATVSLPPSPATAILQVTAGRGTPPGVYPVLVNGTSGPSFHAITVLITVLPAAAPSFGILSGPASVTILPGSNRTSAATVNSFNGFSGDVRLSATVLPTGLGVSFNPADVTVPANGRAYSTIRIGATPNTPAGNYTVVVDGSNGTISSSSTFEVFVGIKPLDFIITSSPASLTIPAGTNNTSTIIVSGLNGFAGDVKLSVTISSPGPSGSITSSSFAVSSAGQPTTSTLTVSSPPSTPPGSYFVTIDGTSGGISHSVYLIMVIIPGAPPNFSISTKPSSIALRPGMGGSSIISLTSLNGFSGTVTLSVTTVIPNVNAPTISFSQPDVSLSSNNSANSTLILLPTASTPNGTYIVFIQGVSGSLSNSWVLEVSIGRAAIGFDISASQSLLSVTQGGSTTSTIALTSIAGFAGTVSLFPCVSCVSPAVPARPIPVFSTGTVSLSPNGVANATLALFTNSTTPVGTYNIILTARRGGEVHFASILLTVNAPPGFSLTATSTDVNLTAGSTGQDNVVVNGFNGFASTVSFSILSNPLVGLVILCTNVTIGPAAIMDTSHCTFNSSVPGMYVVILTGVGGTPPINQVTIFVSVNPATTNTAGFTISTNPATLTVEQGSAKVFHVILRSLGFVGNVSLTVTTSLAIQDGVRLVLRRTSVILGLNSSKSVLVRVVTDEDTFPGNYTIVVVGTAGSLSVSVRVPFVVSATDASSDFGCLDSEGD